MRPLPALAVCALVALALAAPAAARDAVPGEVVVQFRAGADAADRADTLARRRAAVRRPVRERGPVLVRLQQGDRPAAAAAALERDADVLWAEPNYRLRVQRTPNDTYFGSLWGLTAIAAPTAWDTTTGSAAVIAAVVDTGVDVTHSDLAPNVWANSGETAGNLLDDDGNGRVDDVNGWDSYEDDGAPQDEHGHGTHVAGTVGAQGDNSLGVTGVAWDVGLMAIRASDPDGFFTSVDVAEAFDYACDMGARVVNGSFGFEGGSTTIRNAIAACPAALFVFAAGNGGPDGIGDNNDLSAHDPCTAPDANVLCVAAVSPSGLASFSNYGRLTVDLAAPGVDVGSTLPGNGYGDASGTSMASPHVAGAAALVASHRSGLSAVELKNALMNGATPSPPLTGVVRTGGTLNVAAALTAPTTTPPEPPLPPPPPPPPPPSQPVAPDTTAPVDPAVASTSHIVGMRSIDSTVDVTWSGASDFGSGIDGFSYAWSTAATTLPDTTKEAEESIGRTVSAPLAPGSYWFHLRTRDNAGNWSPGTHVGPYVIAPAAVAQPQRCRVPRLKGKTLRAAATVLRRAGCKLGPVKRVRSRVRKGRIVAQRPGAGRRVGKGTPVVVTVSRGR